MAKILDILNEFLHEIEKDNPYKLIGKGGTILSLFYLNRHRESEDLDFDTTLKRSQSKNIEAYFVSILEKLKAKGLINSYSKGKSGLAATNRYLMSIAMETYKTFHTKIDIDFVEPAKSTEKKGEFFYYPIERLFVGKLITFIDRKEFKDIYDIAHMIPKINLKIFNGNPNVAKLVDDALKTIESQDFAPLYKKSFRNADLRFKTLKESEIKNFVEKLLRDLRILRNKIKIFIGTLDC